MSLHDMEPGKWIPIARRPQDPALGWWKNIPGAPLDIDTAHRLHDAGVLELAQRKEEDPMSAFTGGDTDLYVTLLAYYRKKPERHRISYFLDRGDDEE